MTPVATCARALLAALAAAAAIVAGGLLAPGDAKAARGMELAIHPKTVTFDVIRPSQTGLDATKLLPAMVKPADRYLVPDHRDFLAVTLRTAP